MTGLREVYVGVVPGSNATMIVEAIAPDRSGVYRRYTWPDGRAYRGPLPGQREWSAPAPPRPPRRCPAN